MGHLLPRSRRPLLPRPPPPVCPGPRWGPTLRAPAPQGQQDEETLRPSRRQPEPGGRWRRRTKLGAGRVELCGRMRPGGPGPRPQGPCLAGRAPPAPPTTRTPAPSSPLAPPPNPAPHCLTVEPCSSPSSLPGEAIPGLPAEKPWWWKLGPSARASELDRGRSSLGPPILSYPAVGDLQMGEPTSPGG